MDRETRKLFEGCGPINEKLFNFYQTFIEDGNYILFSDHESNVTIIKHLYAWLKEYNQIPNVNLQNKKDNEKSRTLLLAGNKQYLSGTQLTNILDLYNQSICWADGDEVTLGFINRSSVYLSCKRYDISIENINLALQMGHPDIETEKLLKRRALCIERIVNPNAYISVERNEEHFSLNEMEILQMRRGASKLRLNTDSTLSFISEALDLNITTLRGRHYVTKIDLKPGDIISIEEPYVNALTKPYRYRVCANCFQENYMSLIPCKTCTCTMFCSEKCMNEAETFHKFECPIMEYIWEECEEYALTLRLVIKAFTIFNSVDELIEFRKKNIDRKFELNTFFNEKQRYSQATSLLTNESKRSYLDKFIICCKVAILYHFLMEKTEFSQILQTDIHRDTLISLILQYSQISSINAVNCRQINKLDLEHFLDQETDHVFAKGIYPFSSLFNHSCIPNTSTISVGTKLLTYVTRPITSNSVIYGCYQGYHYLNQTRENRLSNLNLLYHFICNCEACTNYYPTHNLMLKYNDVERGDLSPSIEIIDVSSDINNTCKLSKLLKRYDAEYPCPDLSRLWLRFKRAMTCNYGEISTDIQLSLDEHRWTVIQEKKS